SREKCFSKKSEAFQLVQRQLKRRDKVLEEVLDRTHVLFVQRVLNGPLCLNKFGIARAKLLQALDICGELVRRLAEGVFRAILIRLQTGIQFPSDRVRQGRGDADDGELLHFGVLAVQLTVEVLDGRGHVPRHPLATLVIERRQQRQLHTNVPAELHILDTGKGVSEHGDLVRVRHDIFFARGSHELPALDEFPSVKICVELFHGRTIILYFARKDNHSPVQRCASAQILQRSEEHTSELQSRFDLVCRLLLEKKK